MTEDATGSALCYLYPVHEEAMDLMVAVLNQFNLTA